MSISVDIKDDAILWMVNRSVFHPRGYALGQIDHDDGSVEFVLLGNGTEVWSMPNDSVEDEKFNAFEALLKRARKTDNG
jgi:hypothetical protein